MENEQKINHGREYSGGFVLEYLKSHPEHLIIKVQGELIGNKVKLKGSANVKQSGEVYFDDEAVLYDGDSIFCEPDGLVVLRSGGTSEQIDPINGMLVQIGVYFKDTFLAHATVEP